MAADDLAAHRAALAEFAGYTGESAARFACALRGETEEELNCHATQLAAYRASLAPASDRAVDPTQAMSAPSQSANADDWLARKLDNMVSRGRYG